MKKVFLLIVILQQSLLFSCMSFQPLTLDNHFEEDIYMEQEDTTGRMIHLTMSKEKDGKKIIFDRFSTANLNNWYSCNQGTILITNEKAGMNINISKAYNDCFGIYFHPVDVRELPLLEIRASLKKGTPSDIFDITFILEDEDGNKTDIYPDPWYLNTEPGFKNYYFDLQDFILKNSQTKFSSVKNLIIFINTRGGEPASGNFIISHVEFKASNRKDTEEEK